MFDNYRQELTVYNNNKETNYTGQVGTCTLDLV